MATVKVSWFRTETFTREFEVEEYDPDEEGGVEDELTDMINDLDQEELSLSFDGCTEFEITDKKLVE